MRAVLLLLAIAATAVIAWALNGVLVASFTAPVALNAYMTAIDFDPARASMAVMLVAALPFFAYIARHLHASAVMTLSFRSEKDALIGELETANAISDEARRRAEEANLAKSRFLASMSHELRTPLAAIRGYTELAQRRHGDLPAEVAHAMDRVESETARMTRLVEDLLLLARLDAGRPLDRDPVDLTRLVVDAVSDAHVAGPEHTWELDLPDEPVVVDGDEPRLHQVLANLLANARTHTPPGTSVTTALRVADDGAVVLTVTDDGPGIAETLLPDSSSAAMEEKDAGGAPANGMAVADVAGIDKGLRLYAAFQQRVISHSLAQVASMGPQLLL